MRIFVVVKVRVKSVAISLLVPVLIKGSKIIPLFVLSSLNPRIDLMFWFFIG